MKEPVIFPSSFFVSTDLALLLIDAAAEMIKERKKAFRINRDPQRGRTLRPGKDTPLWNAMRKELRQLTARHGEQAKLGRLLGLDRQQINAFLKSGSRMPDAERTLQMLAWMHARQQGEAPC